ncbi:uncharacterized protein LOC112493791 [Cephus cinctus]|uniref:Uncharacterized protein LOC112493791 n=1 Tax=Cephus cinctus TaxID=211228 RepID=A0AAJ7R9G0_CEPCN|nr:uncharacterized protein LOC112493791 [Cephus cinctus]
MTFIWNENLTVKLLALYGRYELLRCPFHPKFRDHFYRYKSYKQIVESMKVPDLTVCECVKRIAFLRRQYCHELSKINISIYNGEFYKPKISWFEMLHELFFPLTQYCDCLEDPDQTLTYLTDDDEDEDEDEDEDDDDPWIQNYDVDENNDSAIDCGCLSLRSCDTNVDHFIKYDMDPILLCNPYKSHQRQNAHQMKPRKYSKVSNERLHLERGLQTDIKRKKVSTKTSTSGHKKMSTQAEAKVLAHDKSTEYTKCKNHSKWSQTRVKHANNGNDVCEYSVTEHEAQTDNKTVENFVNDVDVPNRKQDAKCYVGTTRDDAHSCVNNRNKIYDKYELFGKSVANQLKNLDFESAMNLEKRIKKMMSAEKLFEAEQDFKDTYCKHVCNCDCSHSCIKCIKYKEKKMCSCGLPTNECLPPILGAASNSYTFCCN